MITLSAAWKSLSQTNAKTMVLARLYYGAEGANDYISIGSKNITLSGENFLGIVNDIPSVTQSVNLASHIPTISSTTLNLSNLEYQPGSRFSDFLETIGTGLDVGFENRRADIRLFIPGITSFDDCFKLQTNGKMKRPIQKNQELVIIEIEDNNENDLRDINPLLQDSDAANPNAGLPVESKGATKPVQFGNHQYWRGDVDDLANTTTNSNHNMVKAVYLGSSTLEQEYNYWQLSELKMDVIGKLTAWAPSINRFVQVNPASIIVVTNNDTDGCIIRLPFEGNYYDYWYGDGSSDSFSGNWTSGSDLAMNDSNLNNDAEAFFNDSDPLLSQNLASVNFSGYKSPVDDTDIVAVQVWVKRYWSFDSVAQFFYVNGNDIALFGTEDSTDIVYAGDQAASSAGVESSVSVSDEKQTNAGPGTESISRIFEIWKRILFNTTEVLPLYSAGVGREYGSWINSRTQSEPHANNNDAGDAIQNFSGGIESLLRANLSLTDTDLNLGSFNVFSNDISSLVLSSQITKKEASKKIITDLLTDTLGYLWWDLDAVIKVKAILETYSASDMVINYQDIIDITFDRTESADQKTAYSVEHYWNTEAYQNVTSISQDTNQQTRYKLTAIDSTKLYQTKNVRELVTAEKIRDLQLNFWKQPHNIVIITLPRIFLSLDIGDIIEVQGLPYLHRGEDISINNTRAGQTIYKYWFIYKIQRGGKLKVIAVQLHDLS